MSTRMVPAIRRAGDFSVHTIRDRAIPVNPRQHNEARPKHSSAIAVEHQLLVYAEWRASEHGNGSNNDLVRQPRST